MHIDTIESNQLTIKPFFPKNIIQKVAEQKFPYM